jgi:hypothetical protein
MAGTAARARTAERAGSAPSRGTARRTKASPDAGPDPGTGAAANAGSAPKAGAAVTAGRIPAAGSAPKAGAAAQVGSVLTAGWVLTAERAPTAGTARPPRVAGWAIRAAAYGAEPSCWTESSLRSGAASARTRRTMGAVNQPGCTTRACHRAGTTQETYMTTLRRYRTVRPVGYAPAVARMPARNASTSAAEVSKAVIQRTTESRSSHTWKVQSRCRAATCRGPSRAKTALACTG